MTIAEMMQDRRPIRLVNDDIGGQNLFGVGMNGVTRIECYGEPALHCAIPFLAIYKGDTIIARVGVNSRMTIYYDESEPPSERTES